MAVHREVDSGLAELVPDVDRPGSWLLYLGDAPQSQVDLADPRYLAATRPGSSQLVAETDGALMDLVRGHLPLGRARGRIRVRIADAREVLASVTPGRFDVVISDVFAGARTPPHLATVECTRLAARALRPGGIYIQNVADGPPLSFAKQQAAAVTQVFAHGLLVAEPGVLRRRRFGNLVLAGSGAGLPADELRRRVAADAFAARVLYGEDLDRFVAGTRPATDATAQPSPMPPPAVLTGPAELDGAQP
jgi:hypothetical protein